MRPYHCALERQPARSTAGHSRRPICAVAWLASALLAASTGWSQGTSQVLGRVVDAETDEPIALAEVSIEGLDLRVLTSEGGDFVFAVLPTGEYRLRVERLGYRPVVSIVRVRASRATQVMIELPPMPVELEGVTAEVERVRLIEPDATVSHEITLGPELQALPIDEIEEAVELTTGVVDGHFRGGRIGQETYRIDGLEVKDQLEATTRGTAFELAPTSIAEVEVATGGFGVDNGAALSGVVSYTTRRGDTDRWDGRAALLSDHWAPDDLFRGFSSLSFSAGGPLRFVGTGATLFVDLYAQGTVDGDPRARGLTCLRPDDVDAELAAAIDQLQRNPNTAQLYCPYTSSRLPYQRGDRLIGFFRFDTPVSPTVNLTASFLHNRREQELYSPEFKYNPTYQLGQRTKGYLGNLTLDWVSGGVGQLFRFMGRAALMRLDRYLGAIDPWTFDGRQTIAGFGLSDFRFLGEDFTRSPIEDQIAAGIATPGHITPGGTTGSPFGPAALGIFFTEGTPGIAAWNRTEFVGGDLLAELMSTRGHIIRTGVSARAYRVESYERSAAYLAGSLPSYARFYPTTVTGYGEISLLAAHEVTIRVGARVEAFKSGIAFRADRRNFLSPVRDSEWHISWMPRVGMAVPLPGTGGRSMFRFNYGLVSQPPDFRFFLDTTLGDSLRVDIRRQGNPNLSFEKGTAWEVGLTHLLTPRLSVGAVGFYKELHNLVTSSLTLVDVEKGQFSTGDFGTVKGVEITAEGYWPVLHVRVGYALQSAKGVTSSPFEDPGAGLTEERVQFPLEFDLPHAADLVISAGQAAGATDRRWGFTVTGMLRSGYPLSRTVPEYTPTPTIEQRLPWTGVINLRATYAFGRLPGCPRCSWRVIADVRNVTGRENVIALRRDTGTLAPSAEDLQRIASEVPGDIKPIPRESSDYSALVDLNRDGLITADELRTGRFAAALDRSDPSLYFGSARALRLGIEVAF